MLRLKGFCLKLEHYHFSVAKCFQPTKIKFCFLHFCLSICTYGKTSVDGTVIRQTQHLEIHVLDLSASLIKQTAATKWGADACWAAAAACLQAGHGRKFTKGHAGYYIYINADGPIPEIVWAPRRCAIATGNRMFHYTDYIPQEISPFRSMVASNNRKLI
jgi:hypothetical protein